MKKRVILFDLGNVLIRWNANLLFDKLFSDPVAQAAFMEKFHDWNAACDKSSWDKMLPELCRENPEYADVLHAYRDRHAETLSGPIKGTLEILRQSKAAGYTVYAASNWAADTFEIARADYECLELFDDIMISGQIGIGKPDPAFFERMMNDFAFAADEAVFIDDSAPNVEAARKLGIASILFKDPGQMRQELVAAGISLAYA